MEKPSFIKNYIYENLIKIDMKSLLDILKIKQI